MTLNDVIEIIPIEVVSINGERPSYLRQGYVFKGKLKESFKYFGNRHYNYEGKVTIKNNVQAIVKDELIFDFDGMDITEVFTSGSKIIMDNDNFIVRIKDNSLIDKHYLMAWINLSDNFKSQSKGIISNYYQDLLKIKIDIPPMERQKDVGRLYLITRERFSKAINIINNDNDIISNIMDEIEYESI